MSGKMKWMGLVSMMLMLALTVRAVVPTPTPAPPVAQPLPPTKEESSSIDDLFRADGEENTIPWPWGLESPFPWSFVQGMWLAEHGGFRSYFSFKIASIKGGIRQLEVEQIDPISCKVIARGLGYERDKIVRALMNPMEEGSVFRLAIRAFHEKSVDATVGQKPIYEQYVVLSLFPLDQSKAIHMPIDQVVNHLATQCQPLQ